MAWKSACERGAMTSDRRADRLGHGADPCKPQWRAPPRRLAGAHADGVDLGRYHPSGGGDIQLAARSLILHRHQFHFT